jgi:uncharacterized protein
MNTRNIIIAFVILGVATSLYYIFNADATTEGYRKEINKQREDKDGFMRNVDSSPFASHKELFTGLKYFAPDLRFRIQATLTPIAKREIISLTTNTGEGQSYLNYAWAEFDLDNLHHRLLILEVIEEGPERGNLFLAFADQTSAVETYGAGRYLDIKKMPGANTILLDFNNAYNPYCAYSEKFICPFPTKENILKASIKAGEKVYK